MLSFIFHRIDLGDGRILERFHHGEEWKMFFIVNNMNILLRVKESKCISIMMKLLNKFFFFKFLKILIKNSVYWMITGKLLTRWELLFNRFGGNSVGVKDRDNTDITDKEVSKVMCSNNSKFFDKDFDILQKSMNDLYNYNLSLSNDCYEEILYAKYL